MPYIDTSLYIFSFFLSQVATWWCCKNLANFSRFFLFIFFTLFSVSLYLCAWMWYNRISNALVRAERWKSGKKHSNETVDSLVDNLLKIEIGKMPYKYFAYINRCGQTFAPYWNNANPIDTEKNWPIAKFKINFHQLHFSGPT